MSSYGLSFESPGYLALLAAVPVVWWLSFRGLAALGPVRRIVALGLRTLVLALFVLALAEMQLVHTTDRLTVIYLLDQSASIPQERRETMVDYVNAAVGAHREHRDRVGVIVFGREATVEVPPFDDDVVLAGVESSVDPNYTDLAAAMRLAQASFPEDASKRVVLVSDGDENLGDALEQAHTLAGAGVGIDVVPVHYPRGGEVIVERVSVPGAIREGQPFDLRVVLTNTREAGEGDSGVARGRLAIWRRSEGRSDLVGESEIELPPGPQGKRAFNVQQELEASGFYEYEAVFTPERPDDDTMPQNNRATSFAQIRGKGKVLLIEDEDAPGQFDRLVQTLRRQSFGNGDAGGQKLEVTVMPTSELFTNLAALQDYDSVILANVPRERFTDRQVSMLVHNTHAMGAGLIMLGGPSGFGAGGWANTELEKAMPVDFHVKSSKVVPRGALAMIMHASEMPQGNFWQKKIAEEALKALGPRDYCGVIHYDSGVGCTWLWKPPMSEVGRSRLLMLDFLGRMVPGDMPDFDPGLRMAEQALTALPDAAVKHMIVISDGDPTPPTNPVVRVLANSKITVSTVEVACHPGAQWTTMRDLAGATGGKHYKVQNASALPKIFQREARRVAQPLIYENPAGVAPQIRYPHEMLRGIKEPPRVTGFVMTTRKENPLVEVALISPQPGSEDNRTLLASWTYGLGKTVAFTTDAGTRWTADWTRWPQYDKLFGQMVVWSMRPVADAGKFTVSTDVEGSEVRVIVTALDKDDEYLNFLDMSGVVVAPESDAEGLETEPRSEALDLRLEQTAPGRYVGTFPAREPGSYFVSIQPGLGIEPIRTGVNVPYSDEFRGRGTNAALLGQLAELVPQGGRRGEVIDWPAHVDDVEPLLAVNTFRHDLLRATASQDAWHWLVLAGSCLFFFDVFVRRVQVGFAWVPVLAAKVRDRLLRRTTGDEKSEVLDRLRSSKAEVTDRVEQLRASTRFEPSPEAGEAATLDEFRAPPTPARPSPEQPSLASEKEEESYTERLLRAKKRLWKKTDE